VPVLKWWDWQPHSLLYWGALVQFLSAILFNVSCYFGLPHTIPPGGHAKLIEAMGVWTTSLVGSIGFVFASYVYLVELLQSFALCVGYRAAGVPLLGYAVCMLNLTGSILFTLASACYYIHARPAHHHHIPAGSHTPPPPNWGHGGYQAYDGGAHQSYDGAKGLGDGAYTYDAGQYPRLDQARNSAAGMLDGMVGGKPLWEYEVSEWGVRFSFAVGSALFGVAAVLSLYEIRQNLELDREVVQEDRVATPPLTPPSPLNSIVGLPPVGTAPISTIPVGSVPACSASNGPTCTSTVATSK